MINRGQKGERRKGQKRIDEASFLGTKEKKKYSQRGKEMMSGKKGVLGGGYVWDADGSRRRGRKWRKRPLHSRSRAQKTAVDSWCIKGWFALNIRRGLLKVVYEEGEKEAFVVLDGGDGGAHRINRPQAHGPVKGGKKEKKARGS